MHEVGLVEVTRLVQLTEIRSPLCEEAHVAVFHAGKQQIIGRAARAVDISKEKVEASEHENLLGRLPLSLIRPFAPQDQPCRARIAAGVGQAAAARRNMRRAEESPGSAEQD